MINIKLRAILPSKSTVGFAGLFLMLLVNVVIVMPQNAEAAVGINKMVSFQGKVVNTNGTNVTDGSYSFRFRIYTGPSGDATNPCTANSCVWQETKTVATVNGIFQTYLGDTVALPGNVDFNSDNLYLGVLFNGDTEMSPRIRFSAVPYAFNSNRLGGLESSSFVQLSPSSQQTGSINISGNIVTAGTLAGNTIDAASSGPLVIGSTNSNAITLAENTTLGTGLTLSLQGNNALSLGSTADAGGIVFRDGTANNRSITLSTVGLTASYTLNLPPSAPVAGTQCLQTDVSSTTNLIFGSCGETGDFISLQATTPGIAETGNFNITGVGIAGSFMASNFDTATSTVLNLGTTNASVVNIARTGVVTAIASDTTISGNVTLAAGSARSMRIAQAASGTGDSLTLAGGAAGSAGSNGGNLQLTGGAGQGAGARGVVLIDTPAYSTVTNTSCAANCTIAQANVDNNGAVIVNASATGLTITIPDPTYAVAGRIVYVTGANGSQDFALNLNSGGTLVTIAMRQNSTATLIWNGSDWTAAGASSSTTLQAAYDNTLASAGGAEILLNNTPTSDGLTIRNSANNPIMGSLFEVQSSIGTNFLSVNNRAVEYVANGGAETISTFNSDWLSIGAGTVNRYTTLTNVGTGQASAEVNTPASINTGVRVRLVSNLATSTTYQVSFTGKLSSGSFNSLEVRYTRDGGGSTVPCATYSTQTLTTTGWSKVTCIFSTDSSAAVSPYLLIRQTDATARTFYIDNVSVTLSTISSTPPNVQVGGGLYGGTVTLMTLDRASSPPVANGNEVYYGSMYYDTTSGRIQCYEADGWGACGSAPDNFINLVPEYAGAVLNGTGVGTLTADFCASQVSVLTINATLCGTGQALNYYRWTSPQATQQVYSIYVTYQLPAAFKKFASDSTVSLTARTDNTTNGIVTYQMFRSEGGALTACGSETTVTTSANTWQTVGVNGNEETGCGFTANSANNNVIFKVNVKANSNANVYVGTLSFTTIGQ